MSRFTSRCVADKRADSGLSSLKKKKVAEAIRLHPSSKHREFLQEIILKSDHSYLFFN